MKKNYQWAVLGAGPAGITAVGKLLDLGISPTEILWVDPHFEVGDLGRLWQNVSSNTKVGGFLDFLHGVNSFAYDEAEINFPLNQLDPENTCNLSEVAKPLLWISKGLEKRVTTEQTLVHKIALSEGLWHLEADRQNYQTKNVILATGAIPSSLNHSGVNVLPFEIAIDSERLIKHADKHKTYAIFGSSHSAMLIIRNLVELEVKRIINFYRSPCRYAVEMGKWILFDNTGLKGKTALWARENIDGKIPANLVRYHSNEFNVARFLPECDQVIYAVGFERRKNLVIADHEDLNHNPYVGIIAPGLFGFGIAYPQLKADPLGNVESQVGLWKFLTYLNEVMPIWLKYQR